MTEPSFEVVRTSRELVRVRQLGFALGRWLLFGSLLVWFPVLGLLDGHLAPELWSRLSSGSGWLIVGAAGAAAAGLVLEAVIGALGGGGAARVSVKQKTLRIRRGKRVKLLPLRDFRSGWVLGPSLYSAYQQSTQTGSPLALPRGAVVELETRAGNLLRLEVNDREQARELLATTRLDARHRVLTATLGPTDFVTAMLYLLGPIASGLLTMTLGRALPLVSMSPGEREMLGVWVTTVLFLCLRALVQAYVMPARLTIGNDGVTIDQNLRRTFLPFTSLRDWKVRDDGVEFTRRDGSQVVARGRHLWLDGKMQALSERLEEARRVHLGGHAREEVRQVLVRGGQSLAAWRQSVGEILGRSAGYRDDGGLREEDLREVLESASEPAEARLGAAMALRVSDERLPRRLRVLAASCASEPLRRAFEGMAASEVDDETLEAALAGDARRELARSRAQDERE